MSPPISFVPLILAILSAGAVRRSDSDRFSELFERSKAMERELQTLRADFIETTESDLLAEPLVARGSLVAMSPLRVLMRYREPERKLLFLQGDSIRFVSQDGADDVTLSIGDLQKAIDKYFHRASEKELHEHFQIEVSSDPERPGVLLVDMLPRRKQIQKGLDRLQIWLQERTLTMVKMRMVYPGGVGSKTIELVDPRLNVPVGDDDFRIETASSR